tara:strand:+ start:6879 stop:8051 length:1173 start_codon:yes stop_codon:yes gene_type:complete
MTFDFIYFDHASTTPLSKNVLDKIINSNKNYWGNVSSTYKFGIECSIELESLRLKIAQIFNAFNEDIIFTSGSSESISIVFNKVCDKYIPANLTISAVEHQASIIASNILKRKGWIVDEWEVNLDGTIKIEKIEEYINNKTKLVSIIWGQSEIGTLQPIQYIGKICKQKNILFHIDGTQIISNGIFDWSKLNCDFLSLSAHKFGGPKGVGLLFTRKDSRNILINNDISLTQEYSIRQGTQPLPLIGGIYEALKNIKGEIKYENNKFKFKNNSTIKLSEYLLDKLKENKFIEITGSLENRLPNHISFILSNKNFIPIKAYKVVNYMSENNIAISSGSSCSSSSKKPSIVLMKTGKSENKLFSNIRLSFGDKNSFEEIDKFYNLLIKCIDIF